MPERRKASTVGPEASFRGKEIKISLIYLMTDIGFRWYSEQNLKWYYQPRTAWLLVSVRTQKRKVHQYPCKWETFPLTLQKKSRVWGLIYCIAQSTMCPSSRRMSVRVSLGTVVTWFIFPPCSPPQWWPFQSILFNVGSNEVPHEIQAISL